MPEWMVQQINDQNLEMVIQDLRTFTQKDREAGINEATIKELNALNETEALWYIQHLKTIP